MNEALVFKEKGNAAFVKKDYTVALENFTKAIELQENHIFYSNRSAVYRCLKDYDNALQDAEKCIELDSKWGKGYARKAEVFNATGKHTEALKYYEKALEVEPDIYGVKEMIAQTKVKIGLEPRTTKLFEQMMENETLNTCMQDQNFVDKINKMHKNPSNIKEMMQDKQMMDLCQSLMGSTFGDTFKNLMNNSDLGNLCPIKNKLKNEVSNTIKMDEDDSSDFSVSSDDDDEENDGDDADDVVSVKNSI